MKRVEPSIPLVLLALAIATGRASAQNGAALGGVVRDPQGAPQMGALVELLGSGSLVVAHAYTDDHGRYLIPALLPGSYQLRTSAAFLLPALRRNVHLVPGGRTLANVTLTTMFQVGDWFPVEARAKEEPADDWRWTLRSTAERPLLRFAGDDEGVEAGTEGNSAAGEGKITSRQAFGFATTFGSFGLTEDGIRQSVDLDQVRGDRSLTVQATVGSTSTAGEPPPLSVSTGFEQSSPSTQGKFKAVAQVSSLPELRSGAGSGFQVVDLATGERIQLGDIVTIDAGTLLSAERLASSHLSTAPFLRLVVHPASGLALMYRYAGSEALQSLDDLDDMRVAVSPLGDKDGRPFASPATHQELAVARIFGGTSTSIAIYQDHFTEGVLAGGGAAGEELGGLPIVANGASGTFVFALPGYTAQGISGSWTQTFGPTLKLSVQANLGTALSAKTGGVVSLATVQDEVSSSTKAAVAADLTASLPATATSFEVKYHWQPTRTLSLIDAFDQPANEAYATLKVRQKLWTGKQLRSVNAVLEATNLLEEGYQPMIGPDGKTLFLAQVPRAVQAGLTFSF